MKSNRLNKIDNFAKRHLLFSSFVCLMILGVIINFYWSFDRRESSYTFVGIEEYIHMVKWSILGTFLWDLIPIFLISLLLTSFLKKESLDNIHLPFYQKFILSFITVSPIIFLFFTGFFGYGFDFRYYPDGAFVFLPTYSVIFSLYFGWFSNASRIGIIIHCFVVTLLMGALCIIMAILHSSGA